MRSGRFGESENTRDVYPRRRPALHPQLARVQVAEQMGAWVPELFPYSEYDSERFGGFGATTTVVQFPGDPMQYAWDFQPNHPRPAARKRGQVRGFTVPAPVPQTVSDRTRQQLAEEEEGLVPGMLDIFEGIGA